MSKATAFDRTKKQNLECSNGLANLLLESPFDFAPPAVLDCPVCGENVRLKKGVCPSCHEPIFVESPGCRWEKPGSIVSADGIVFLHFDVESGELSYMQGGTGRFGVEHVDLALDEYEIPVMDLLANIDDAADLEKE